MALVKYSSIVNDIRGSVGNATFQRGVSGNVLRNKPVPHVQSGLYTSPVRIIMSRLVHQWSTLTPAQQQAWTNFLVFSPEYMKRAVNVAMSGYQLFLRYNSIALLTNLGYLDDITLAAIDFAPSTPDAYIYSSRLFVILTASDLPANWGYMLRMSPPSRNRNIKGSSGLRIIKTFSSPGTNYDITTPYQAVWNVIPVAGQAIFMEVTFFHLTMPYIYSKHSATITF